MSVDYGTLNENLTNVIRDIISDIGLNIDLINVVGELPTESEDTMNQLYLIPEVSDEDDDYFQIFVTVRTGTAGNYQYDWERVDQARIDLSGYATLSDLNTKLNIDFVSSLNDITNPNEHTLYLIRRTGL